jgi:hypothetical protein
MAVPTAEELAEGYAGCLWMARKGPWTLEVRWRGDLAKFFCRLLREDESEPREARTFDYPHEVVEWVGTWFAQLARAR